MECFTIIFRIFLLQIIWMVDGIIRPNTSLSILDGEGFVAYLEVVQDFGVIKNCFFKFQDEKKVRIDLNTSKPVTTARNETVFPFAPNVCGIKVSNVSSVTAATWFLEAESINNSVQNDSITINVLSAQKMNFDTRIQLEIGKTTVKCSTHQHQMPQCKMINILNGAIYHQCELNTTIYAHSMFECFTSDWGHMGQTHERIFFDNANNTPFTNRSLTDEENAIILGCDFRDKIFSCQAEMPINKSELLIMDGLFDGHYSAYKTITSKSRCNLEIPKPFREQDIGLWRIINYDSNYPYGCLFYVGKPKEDIILAELHKELNKTEIINVYEAEEDDGKINYITCTVPFIIYDCYLRSPNNTLYFPDGESFERQRLLGKCAFYNMPIIAGIWKCGCRGRDYDKEIVQDIEVVVKSKFGETFTKVVKVRTSDTAELMCKTSFEEPISHCAFIDPQGDVHLIGTTNSIKLKGRHQYVGRGINKGECGIKITDINRNDFGQWKCQFTAYNEGLKSSFLMDLQESVSIKAMSIGLGIGVAVIIILILGVLIGTIFYRRRNSTACHNFISNHTLELSTMSSVAS